MHLRHAGAFARAAHEAPFTLATFHGAFGAYVEALARGGFLPPAPSSKSWLDRAAFDATSADGDDSEVKSSATRRSAQATSTTDRHLLYAVNNDEETIDIYQTNLPEPANQNQPMIGQIALPYYAVSVAVSGDQHLFVAEARNVLEYTRKSMPNPIRTIALPHSAESMAIAPDGTLYAANFSAYLTGGTGVFVVPPGATAPSTTLNDPTIYNGLNVAVDQNGDLFVIYEKPPTDTASKSAVGEFVAGSTTLLNLPIADAPGDVQIDAQGNLLLSAADSTIQNATLDVVPSGSVAISKSIVIETKFDYIYFDHKPAADHLWLVEQNVGSQDAEGQIFKFRYPLGLQLDDISNGSTYLRVATAPYGAYPPAWIPPATFPTPVPTAAPSASSSPIANPNPTQSPVVIVTPTTAPACSSGTIGPVSDGANNLLYWGGSTSCATPYPLAITTISLYNGLTNNLLSKFTISDTQGLTSKRVSVTCPGIGSYYVQVTSNVAPTVTSATVESTKNAFGSPSC